MIQLVLFFGVALAASASSAPSARLQSLELAEKTYGACMILASAKIDDGVTDIHVVRDLAAPECDSLIDPVWQAALREVPDVAGHEAEFKTLASERIGLHAILYRRAQAKRSQ